MSARLSGKVAVITGGASGIGEATVRRFVAEGARVVIADLQDDLGRSLAGELGAATEFARTDVTDESSVAAAVELAVSRFGRLDVMFNNAGVLGAVGPLASTPVEAFDFTIAVDLRGVFLGMKHAARAMEPQRSGVILSTASPGGVAGGLGPHAYSAAKAAVVGLSRSVAAELRPKGIRVNVLVPGAIVSPMTAAARTGDPEAQEATRQLIAESSSIGAPGRPSDVAAAAAYLASDDASFVTGAELVVDGGLLGAPGASPYAADDMDADVLRERGRRGIGGSTR